MGWRNAAVSDALSGARAGWICAPSRYLRREYESDVPTMNRKNGKMRSVGVQPCQGACSSGQYWYFSPHWPGLLTRIIARMVTPRKTSSDKSRPLPAFAVAGSDDESGDAFAIDAVEYIESQGRILATGFIFAGLLATQ